MTGVSIEKSKASVFSGLATWQLTNNPGRSLFCRFYSEDVENAMTYYGY